MPSFNVSERSHIELRSSPDRFSPSSGPSSNAAGFLCVCVRVPKSGSLSLSILLKSAFADRCTFYLPDTCHLDGQISALQRLRFHRSRMRNLMERCHTVDIRQVFAAISTRAADGDLIDGGHIDFATVTANIPRRLKMITMLRDPVERCRSEYNYARGVYGERTGLRCFTAALLPRAAGRRDFDGFLDFLMEYRSVYGNIACRYLGWDQREDLSAYFSRSVFHSGILEQRERFARDLSEKLGKRLAFPHQNRTQKAAVREVSMAQRRKIEQIYEHDCVLYEWQRANL